MGGRHLLQMREFATASAKPGRLLSALAKTVRDSSTGEAHSAGTNNISQMNVMANVMASRPLEEETGEIQAFSGPGRVFQGGSEDETIEYLRGFGIPGETRQSNA